MLCSTLSLFSSFAHQTAREIAEIARPRGIRRSVMVVTRKYHYPAYKPPPLFCPMLDQDTQYKEYQQLQIVEQMQQQF